MIDAVGVAAARAVSMIFLIVKSPWFKLFFFVLLNKRRSSTLFYLNLFNFFILI